MSRLLWQTARSGERLDPNADTDKGLELKESLYYSTAEYKQKQKVTMTKLAKPKLEETFKTRIKKLKTCDSHHPDMGTAMYDTDNPAANRGRQRA